MYRIRAESEATKALYTEATYAVQSVVVGDDKAVWIRDLFPYIGQHYLLGHEGSYFSAYFLLSFVMFRVFSLWNIFYLLYKMKKVRISNMHFDSS